MLSCPICGRVIWPSQPVAIVALDRSRIVHLDCGADLLVAVIFEAIVAADPAPPMPEKVRAVLDL